MLEVIGAGFGRTGTNSLREALQILGFDPCHHMYALHEHPETLTDWEAIAAGATPDWDKMFADFRAQVDWPGACYWRDLSEHFPNAKVILSTRDPEGWHKSMMKTVIPTLYAGGTRETDWLNRLSEHNRVTIGERVFGGKSRDPAQAISVYEAHVAEVTATIAPDRKSVV